jgi:hypothetical protein
MTKIKLKGISFAKTGEKAEVIREKEGICIHGELPDGRPTTQVILWDSEIEIKASNPLVTQGKKRKGK